MIVMIPRSISEIVTGRKLLVWDIIKDLGRRGAMYKGNQGKWKEESQTQA